MAQKTSRFTFGEKFIYIAIHSYAQNTPLTQALNQDKLCTFDLKNMSQLHK